MATAFNEGFPMTDPLPGLIKAREIAASVHSAANAPHKAYDAAFIQVGDALDAAIAEARKGGEGCEDELKTAKNKIIILQADLARARGEIKGMEDGFKLRLRELEDRRAPDLRGAS
jgi:hypothetical protein